MSEVPEDVEHVDGKAPNSRRRAGELEVAPDGDDRLADHDDREEAEAFTEVGGMLAGLPG